MERRPDIIAFVHFYLGPFRPPFSDDHDALLLRLLVRALCAVVDRALACISFH